MSAASKERTWNPEEGRCLRECRRCFEPFEIVVRRSWAATSISARAAERLSLGTTPVGIGTARSARERSERSCVVPGGGLSPTGEWISCRPGFFLPIRVLADRFRNLFIDLLEQAVRKGDLRLPTDLASNPSAFRVWLDGLRHKRWVVYSKPPFGGPAAVMQYLGRYTHRVAISNARLLAIDEETVTYRWKDYRAGGCWKEKESTISGVEFLRRFAQHILPDGFVRIRYYGLLANRGRDERIAQCRALLDADDLPIAEIEETPGSENTWRCPVCGEAELVLHGPPSEMPPARPSVENARAPPRRCAMT